MLHRLAETGRQHAIPIRATQSFPPENRAALWNMVDLRTAWPRCAWSLQCLIGWTGGCGRQISFANS